MFKFSGSAFYEDPGELIGLNVKAKNEWSGWSDDLASILEVAQRESRDWPDLDVVVMRDTRCGLTAMPGFSMGSDMLYHWQVMATDAVVPLELLVTKFHNGTNLSLP